MANKFSGKIGFEIMTESKPGVWVPQEIEKGPYYGEVLQKTIRLQAAENVNDNIKINHRISVISDAFAKDHIDCIKYVMWMGKAWKVVSIDINYPRLTLNIGDIYTRKQKKGGE
ncbi:MAG: hypothetical protein J6Y02_17850 [Pseudobutyrivibrio sp.]|nr:hypothetical protein [Pseudobutyrivibrio sp.]